MTFEEYRKIPKINASLIKEGSKSVWHAWMALNFERKETESMKLGTAIHCAVLEPSEFNKRYAIMSDDIDKRTKEGKETFKKFEEENKGKIILKKDDGYLINKIISNIDSNELLRSIINNGQKEYTIEKKNVKARFDVYDEKNGIICDVKTSDNLDIKSFKYDIIKYGYDIQLYHYYLCAKNIKEILIIGVETSTGHVCIYDVTSLVLNEKTQEKFSIGLSNVLEAKKLKTEPPKFGTEKIIISEI